MMKKSRANRSAKRSVLPKWKQISVKKKREQIEKYLRWATTVLIFGLVSWMVFVGARDILQSRWDGKERINVVMATPSISVFSYNPNESSGWRIMIPDEAMIRVVRGYGEYPAKSLIKLDAQENLRGNLLKESVGEYFGVETKGYILGDWDDENIRSYFLQTIAKKFLKRRVTDLSWFDLIRINTSLIRMRPDLYEVVDLSKTRALNRSRSPDGRTIFDTDFTKLSELSSRWFVEEGLVNESLNVLVVNGSGREGLAGGFVRKLHTMGISAVGVETSREVVNKSEVLINDSDLKSTETVGRLEKVLGVSSEKDKNWFDDRADIVVRLGSDYSVKILGE